MLVHQILAKTSFISHNNYTTDVIMVLFMPLFKNNLNRRQLLTVGAAGIAGLTLPRILSASSNRARVTSATKADSCIVIF